MSTDFVISFDTTGSMYPCLTEVRERVAELVQRLFSQNPDARIALAAHGDYCDSNNPYTMVYTTFLEKGDERDLINFAQTAKKTNGGDGPECYEYVMYNVERMDWQAENKVFIIFADAVPHRSTEPQNYLHLDWQVEARKLADKGVNIYSIQCLHYGPEADRFYESIANLTNGYHLHLHQFSNAVEAILAVSSKQAGKLEEYQNELEDSFSMNRGLSEIFKTLGSTKVADKKFTKSVSGLIPVSPTRFQILTVPTEIDIKSFVESTGAYFRKGRGFYQFTKRETIQENKEVVLRDKLTGDLYTGADARVMIGLPYGERGDISPKFLSGYEVYVQSTSSNRKLMRNTKFLYEVG
jgi:hypothetical protein